MAGIIWTTAARFDLQLILATIRREAGQRHADKWGWRFTKAVEQIEAMPEIGSPVEEYPWRQYREQIIGPYRLIYRFDGTNCRIVAVPRADRDLARRLDPSAEDDD